MSRYTVEVNIDGVSSYYDPQSLAWAYDTAAIDTQINPHDRDIVEAAIMLYRGTKATFSKTPENGLRVQAALLP
jgi:hypothetical protein